MKKQDIKGRTEDDLQQFCTLLGNFTYLIQENENMATTMLFTRFFFIYIYIVQPKRQNMFLSFKYSKYIFSLYKNNGNTNTLPLLAVFPYTPHLVSGHESAGQNEFVGMESMKIHTEGAEC